MGRELNERVMRAFIAMKNIGIAAEKVKPALKRLLKVFDNNWELIEDDNYRALADGIFEFETEQKHEKNDASTTDNPEPPCKESNRTLPECQASCTVDDAGPEMGEIPQRPEGQKLTGSSQLLKGYHEGEPCCSSRHAPDRDIRKPKVAVSSVVRGESSNEPRPLQKNEINQEFHDRVNQRKRTREESINCLPHSALPSPCLSTGKNLEANGSASDLGTSFQCKCEIASSKCGQAAISLSCKYAFEKHDNRSPNLDAVLKYVEEQCLSSYKIIGSKFSLVELLRCLCDSYVELSTDSARRSMVNKVSGNSHPRLTGASKTRSMTDILENNVKITAASSSSNAPSRPVIQSQRVNHNGHKIPDITKGTEKVKIMLLDEVGKERLPDFIYIPQSISYQFAQIHVSLARIVDDDCCSSCSGDCLSYSLPCVCARDTKGEFAYTPDGLLTEDFLRNCISMTKYPEKHYHFYCEDCPLERAKNKRKPGKCKGHLVRKFIKECWRKCGCNMLCGNRVVQRGITRKLQVFLAEEGKGWGIRTLEDLPQGAFVCEYVGEILTNMELYERNQRSTGSERHTYPVLLDADWGSEKVLKDEEALCLDATNYGNVARFVNHRCEDANLLDIPVEVETPDHHYYHLAFFTKRKVDAFEELTWDYKLDFDDHNHPIKAFQCCCKSAYCRDKKGKKAKMITS